LLDEVRLRFPGTLTVLGGVGVTPIAEALVKKGAAEVIVRGEGEETFSDLVSVYGSRGRQAFHEVEGITFSDQMAALSQIETGTHSVFGHTAVADARF